MPTTAVVTLLGTPVLTVQSRITQQIHGGRSILINRCQSTEWISPPAPSLVRKLTLLALDLSESLINCSLENKTNMLV